MFKQTGIILVRALRILLSTGLITTVQIKSLFTMPCTDKNYDTVKSNNLLRCGYPRRDNSKVS